MLVIKKIVKNEDGTYDALWNLSSDQMDFLMTYAINSLLEEGLIQVEERVEQTEKQMQLDLLDALDEQELPQA